MLQSKLFTKTRKESPKDETSKNADLLIRGGYIYKEIAGAYTYLPLGLRVLKKIENIIREEMNAVGGQEILMTALQDPELWKQTGRWDDAVLDVWFKTRLKNDTEIGLATTHEEPLTNMLTTFVRSYKDLPFSVYQFQTKFRNELRAKSGIMRGREFIMKDLYSFSRTSEEHEAFYAQMKDAYVKVFERAGIGQDTYFTYASGGSFSEASHEFQALTEAGEDTIFICDDCHIAVNKEVIGAHPACPECGKSGYREERAVEVGNIFPLGTKFSEPLGLTYIDEAGNPKPVIMGSYGIGLGRLMGTIVEMRADEKGIVWPESVAPFDAHVLLVGEDAAVREAAEQTVRDLEAAGLEVLFDDRPVRPGEKFADSDLIGIPWRVIVSEKTLAKDSVEIKWRSEESSNLVPQASLIEEIKKARA